MDQYWKKQFAIEFTKVQYKIDKNDDFNIKRNFKFFNLRITSA